MPRGNSRAYICTRNMHTHTQLQGTCFSFPLIMTAECARVSRMNAMNHSIVHFPAHSGNIKQRQFQWLYEDASFLVCNLAIGLCQLHVLACRSWVLCGSWQVPSHCCGKTDANVQLPDSECSSFLFDSIKKVTVWSSGAVGLRMVQFLIRLY